jgi:transposase-like protein
VFDRTRTPLTVSFNACWLFSTSKDGVSALSLQRTLEIGSYQTAWAMLHRLRAVLVRPDRELLSGTVEVDETFIGGQEPGLRGGRAKGKKVLTAIAVEVIEPRGFGRVRMAPVTDGSAASLHAFVTDHVAPGAKVITDGWDGYRGLDKLGYTHEPRSQRAARARGENPGELLPAVHRVASLAKRWLLGTHQGAIGDAHLPDHLDEFVFRFNRRRSRSRGLLFYRVLQLAVDHDPVRYRDLIAQSQPEQTPRKPPHPSLTLASAGCPQDVPMSGNRKGLRPIFAGQHQRASSEARRGSRRFGVRAALRVVWSQARLWWTMVCVRSGWTPTPLWCL